MAKKSEEQKLMRTWWVLLVLAAAFIGLAYGFGYLATDSGSLWQYAVSIIFLIWGIRYIITASKYLLRMRT